MAKNIQKTKESKGTISEKISVTVRFPKDLKQEIDNISKKENRSFARQLIHFSMVGLQNYKKHS